jgi:NAD(P)-dependent dehydrogenase (short-subunit alcohol dehydrogenase family)
MRHVEGRHVIVTGAGTGIGRAIALRLAREGAALSLLARDTARLEETAGMAPPGSRIHVERCDIRELASVERAVTAAVAEQGPVHALVANAGLGGPNDPGPDDRFADLVATNLNGTYHCVRAVQPHLAPGPQARHIVITSSILARIGVPGYTGYCASKAGLLGLTRSLAAELAKDEIQVNAICPGWVDTDMAWQGIDAFAADTGRTREEAYAEAMREVPMGRMSQPEDIAGTVVWLLSGDARGVTGQAIDHNNGAFML